MSQISYKLGILGQEENVRLFAALGMDAFPVGDKEEGMALLSRLCKSGEYASLFIQEATAELLGDELKEMRKKTALPAMLVIPGGGGMSGIGQKELRAIIEKAIGSDLPNLS